MCCQRRRGSLVGFSEGAAGACSCLKVSSPQHFSCFPPLSKDLPWLRSSCGGSSSSAGLISSYASLGSTCQPHFCFFLLLLLRSAVAIHSSVLFALLLLLLVPLLFCAWWPAGFGLQRGRSSSSLNAASPCATLLSSHKLYIRDKERKRIRIKNIILRKETERDPYRRGAWQGLRH